MQVSANGARSLQQTELYHDDIRQRPMASSGRLVYAKPQDLPSFPSLGLDARGSAASAAASLGWANQKSPKQRRQSTSVHALTAATMADDDKPAPASARIPMGGNHGAKAALLAAQSATASASSKPSPSDDGLSAATLAFRSNRTTVHNTNSVALEHHRSLVAAKGAVARRHRAGSAPIPRNSYPDEANAAANALNAATRAHRPTLLPAPHEEAGAIPYTTMNKLMFTSRPPVKPEVDEQKRADVLHASAVAMAKRMYNQQQKMIEARQTHADTSSRGDLEVSSSVSHDPQPAHLTTLQDAAYKQAQARLAKMQQDIAQNRGVPDHYGMNPLSHRFSVRGKLRKRSLSDGVVIEDQKRSQEIRKQMSLFSDKLSEVDEQKRQKDQEMLLAAAQRNVHERLKGMDAKIATETGMAPPPTLTQWELKARALAQSRIYQQGTGQQEKVDIGAGMQMDQEDINAIAARRIQPILDEINARAELEHARQTELRLDLERKREEQEVEKARQREVLDIQKKLKQQEKLGQKERRAEEKQEAKARKEEEKATRAEQKRLARTEKSRSTGHGQGLHEEPESQPDLIVMNSNGQPVRVPRLSTQEAQTGTSPERSEESPTSPGGIKTWFKSRFSRGLKSSTEEQSKGQVNQKRFVGGVSLTGGRGDRSSPSLHSRSNSAREVAISGRNSDQSTDSDDEFSRGRVTDQPLTTLSPPRPIRDTSPAQGRSPIRDSRFREMM